MNRVRSMRELSHNKNIQFLGIVVTFFVLFIGVRKNYLQNNMEIYNDDEIHTVYYAIQSMETGRVENFRSLEGSRWMYRLFYPGALIKMSQKMGGNTALTGWSRTGHNYILDEYIHKDASPFAVRHRMATDPNLRDFFYYIRLQSLIFVFLSLIPLLYYCFKHKYYIALVFLIVFPVFNHQLSYEQSLAYVEPLLLGFISIVLSLFLYLFDKRKISYFMISFIVFVGAFTISVKFSSLFFVVMLLATPFINKEDEFSFEPILKKMLFIVGAFAFFFVLINYYGFFGDFNMMLHDFVSNFWNYSNGQSINASSSETAGFINNFKRTFYQWKDLIGYAIYILPILWILGFKYADRSERIKYGIIFFVLTVSIFSLLGQVEFYDRNLVPFYMPFLFISGVSLSIIIRKYNDKVRYKNKKVLAPIVLIVFLIGYSFVFFKFKDTILPSSQKHLVRALNEVPNLEARKIDFINMDESILESYANEKKDITSDIFYTSVNYKEKLSKLVTNFGYNDVVMVNRDKNNYNQYSNFLLPRYYDTNMQYGDNFIFYNKSVYDAEDEGKNILQNPVVLMEGLNLQEIKLKRIDSTTHEITMVFDDFANEELLNGKIFYFHAYSYPDNINGLPEERIQYGYDNLDFKEMNVNHAFGKPIITRKFNPTLDRYQSFRFGLMDVNSGVVIKEFAIEAIQL